MKRIAYISAQDHVKGVANTARVQAMRRALEISGTEVDLMAHQSYLSERWENWSMRWSWLAKTLRIRTWAIGSAVTPWLDQISRPDAVVVYGTDLRFLLRAAHWCRVNRVPLLCEVVDWYRLADASGVGARVFAGLNGFPMMRFIGIHAAGLIVASTFLKDQIARGQPTVVIPAAIEVPEETLALRGSAVLTAHRVDSLANGVLRVMYAGSMNLRDWATVQNLKDIILAEAKLPLRLEVHVYGWEGRTEETSTGSIVFHGRVDRNVVSRQLAHSHFTVLQRDSSKWFAKAGFPSKVAESLMAGVPVIANLTSDLSDHLEDGFNAVVVESDGMEALRTGLVRAMEGAVPIAPMHASAIRDDAVERFGVDGNARRLREFLGAVEGGRV